MGIQHPEALVARDESDHYNGIPGFAWEAIQNSPEATLDVLVLDDAKIAVYGIDKDGNPTSVLSRTVAVASITPIGKIFKGVKSIGGIADAIKDIFKAAKEGKKVAEVGKILITSERLSHVINNHTIEGVGNSGKSIFSTGENLTNLIKRAENTVPVKQSSGNYERMVDAGRIIGVDRATEKATNIYTIITDEGGNLVTAFPGKS